MTAPESQQQSKPQYDVVLVSDRMRDAGIAALKDGLRDGDDFGAIAGSVYLAMEYERLESLGQLTGFVNNPLKVRKS